MNIRMLITIILAALIGTTVYFFYLNFFSGLNNFLAITFSFLLLLMVAINIALLVQEPKAYRKVALTIFTVLCFSVAVLAAKVKMENMKNDSGTPRKYLSPKQF